METISNLLRECLNLPRYSKPYLKQALARVDFIAPIHELRNSLPNELNRDFIEKFPIPDHKEIRESEVIITSDSSGDTAQTREDRSMNWCFRKKDRSHNLNVNMKFLYIECLKYHSFEALSDELFLVIDKLVGSFPDLQFGRLGLRYINSIEIDDEPNPTEWSAYIKNSLLTKIDIVTPDQITRIFNIFEFMYDDMNLRFQYGMHNPDFPAAILKKVFILDYDAYSKGVFTYADVKTKLKLFHEKISELFEFSIEDALRDRMR